MSWDTYLSYREAKSNKRKRRKLFSEDDCDITQCDSSDNENIAVVSKQSSVRVIRADQITSTQDLLDNSFKKKKKPLSSFISSFHSDSDDESKKGKVDPIKTVNNKRRNSVNTSKTPKFSENNTKNFKKTPTDPITRTKQFASSPIICTSSPTAIESFESDSSCSAIEATPPPIKLKKRNLHNINDLSDEDDSECGLEPGSMFQHMQQHSKKNKHQIGAKPANPTKAESNTKTERPRPQCSIKTVNPITTLTKFSSNFDDFSTNKMEESFVLPEQKLSNAPSRVCKKSAADWIKNLKSPERKQQLVVEDESTKKSLTRKHPPGSLAYKAQRLNSFNRGEYQMWLHKNIAGKNQTAPFSEFCYYGIAKRTSLVYGLTCVETNVLDCPTKSVTILIPSTQKCGDFAVKKVIVVFPQFYCYNCNNQQHIFSSFHAQFFNADEHDFSKIPKVDHFLGVTNRSDSQSYSLSSCLESCRIPEKIVSIDQISSSKCIQIYICIYQISKKDGYFQIIGLDVSSKIIIIEVTNYLAKKFWDQLSLSVGASCHLTRLKLIYTALAMKSYYWFPEIQQFPITTKTKIWCLDTVDESTLKLQGDVTFDQKLCSSLYTNRCTIMCRYLCTVQFNSITHISYISTMFGSLHWITHSFSIPFSDNSVFKFSGLQRLTPESYNFDSLSSYAVCVTSEQPIYEYPNLYHIVEERELGMFTEVAGNVVGYNQYLPTYSPVTVTGAVISVVYSERRFTAQIECCGVKITATILPATLRTWLRTESIVEQDLKQLRGYKCSFQGIVTGKLKVTEVDLTFLYNR